MRQARTYVFNHILKGLEEHGFKRTDPRTMTAEFSPCVRTHIKVTAAPRRLGPGWVEVWWGFSVLDGQTWEPLSVDNEWSDFLPDRPSYRPSLQVFFGLHYGDPALVLSGLAEEYLIGEEAERLIGAFAERIRTVAGPFLATYGTCEGLPKLLFDHDSTTKRIGAPRVAPALPWNLQALERCCREHNEAPQGPDL